MGHIHELYDFTVSAFILHPSEEKICLHYHLKLDSWLQPGGHIELEEDPVEALERELLEETGLELNKCEVLKQTDRPKTEDVKTLLQPFQIFTHYYDEKHQHIDLTYLIRSNTEELEPQEGESIEIKWLTIPEIRKLSVKKQLFANTLDICEWIAKDQKFKNL